ALGRRRRHRQPHIAVHRAPGRGAAGGQPARAADDRDVERAGTPGCLGADGRRGERAAGRTATGRAVVRRPHRARGRGRLPAPHGLARPPAAAGVGERRMSSIEATRDADLLVLRGEAGDAEFADAVAAHPVDAAAGPDLALWRDLLRRPVFRTALDPDRDADDALRELGALAVSSGRSLAPVPFVYAVVTVRALTRVGTSAALDAAWHVREGDQWGALARVSLDAGRVLVPTPAGVALAARESSLVLLERRHDAEPVLPGLAGSQGYAWDAAGSVLLPDGVEAYARAMSEWRILAACRLVGMLDGALELARDHATSRVQFDAPIGSF